MNCCGNLPEGRDQPGDLFQLEEEIRGHVAAGDEEAEAARGRECTAEEDCRGSDVGPRDVAGRHSPKALRPARKREMVKGMCQDWDLDPACLWGAGLRSVDPPLHLPPCRSGRS